MKKKNGEIQQFLIQMIGIIVSFAILLYGIAYTRTIITYNNVNQIARKYTLRMETHGWLNGDDKNDLLDELSKVSDIEDIDISGSTMDKQQEYGKDVILEINFTEQTTSLEMDGLSISFVHNKMPVKIMKSSTAKYWVQEG